MGTEGSRKERQSGMYIIESLRPGSCLLGYVGLQMWDCTAEVNDSWAVCDR